MRVKDKNAELLELTPELNALDYLERAHKAIREVRRDAKAWKWMVIALHGALYGYAIAMLRASGPGFVEEEDGKLICFPKAVRRCRQKKWALAYTFSKPLKLSPKERESIKSLNSEFRNAFAHYNEGVWVIEPSLFITIAEDTLAAIRFIALESGNCIHVLQDKKHCKRIKQLVHDCSQILAAL